MAAENPHRVRGPIVEAVSDALQHVRNKIGRIHGQPQPAPSDETPHLDVSRWAAAHQALMRARRHEGSIEVNPDGTVRLATDSGPHFADPWKIQHLEPSDVTRDTQARPALEWQPGQYDRTFGYNPLTDLYRGRHHQAPPTISYTDTPGPVRRFLRETFPKTAKTVEGLEERAVVFLASRAVDRRSGKTNHLGHADSPRKPR